MKKKGSCWSGGIFNNLKSNIFLRKKSNLEDDFLSSGTMQLNGSSDIDKLKDVENVKGSEDNDHILGTS